MNPEPHRSPSAPPPLPSQMPPPMPPTVLPYGSGVPCPRCGYGLSEPVKFTWWGGLLGPKLLSHVRCTNCRYAFNGKTGRSNTTGIVVYTVVLAVIGLIVGIVLFASV